MLLTQEVQDLLTDGFQHIIDERELPRWSPLIERYFNIFESEKPDENVSEITGFGLMAAKTQGGPVSYDDILQAFDTTFTPTEYALATEISEIAIEDDQYQKLQSAPMMLMESVTETVETIGANTLNRGFTSSFSGGDGLELFSRVHVLRGGGTLANEPSAQADFTATSYRQSEIDIAAWTDHRGKKLRFRPARLIVPTEVVWDAEIVFGSRQDPDTAQNAINPANSRRLEIVENPYLTSTQQWTVQCQKHYLAWYWRRRPRSGRDNDFQTSNFRWKMDMRVASGWWSPLGIYSSSGAGT